MIRILPLDTPSLGDRSYLIHDGNLAVVIDPQRDIDRVLALAAAHDVRITHVFETHIHNDYVTGGLALARACDARYHVNAEDDVAFTRTPIRDTDTIQVSAVLSVRAIATPGHTFTHLSYALLDRGRIVGVCTGGSLLYGATGRPDLLGPQHAATLARHQHASAHRLAQELPDDAAVLPTHGFGSFCSAGAAAGAQESTIGAEKQINPALRQAQQPWVEALLAGLEAYPAYYAQMGPANAAGPPAVELGEPRQVDAPRIAASIAAGEWVVDLRTRTAYADGHVVGSINIGLDGQFATYLGWLIPWGTPLTLLGQDRAQIVQAQRELVRIGIDQLHGSATGEPRSWTSDDLATLCRATFADLASVRHHRRVTTLDVRRATEFDAGHITGARHIPLHELLHRLEDVGADELWVHCAGGYRAAIAASLLTRAGHRVVAVDDAFEPNARAAGLPMTTG